MTGRGKRCEADGKFASVTLSRVLLDISVLYRHAAVTHAVSQNTFSV